MVTTTCVLLLGRDWRLGVFLRQCDSHDLAQCCGVIHDLAYGSGDT